MIVYGSSGTHLGTSKVKAKCQSCETPDSIDMSVFQRYAHIFWIPTFPMNKKGVAVCESCKQVTDQKEFTPVLTESYESVKAQTKTPIWTFSGLAIIVALISWGMISSEQNNKKNAEIIVAPLPGDVYEVKLSSSQYTLYKVQEVNADTVYLIAHLYETNKSSGISDLKKKGDEGYDSEMMFGMLTSELKEMLDKGEIIDIDRD